MISLPFPEIKKNKTMEQLGMKYPPDMAPLEQKYRKYDVYGRFMISFFILVPALLFPAALIFGILDVILFYNNYYYTTPTAAIGILLLGAGFFYFVLVGWLMVPAVLFYYYSYRPARKNKAIKEILTNLLIMNTEKATLYREVKDLTNIEMPVFMTAVQGLIMEKKLDGILSKEKYIPKSLTMSKTDQIMITERHMNRFKGMLRIKGKVPLEDIARSFDMTNYDVELMIYELVGSGIVQLTLVDGFVSIPEEHDVDTVINDLEAAFLQWEANLNSKSGKL